MTAIRSVGLPTRRTGHPATVTATPAPSEPAPSQPASAASSASVLLLGVGAVLGAMAVTFLVLGLWQHEDSTRVCGTGDATMGDCLVTADLAMREARLIWVGAVTLGVGSVAALVSGAVAAGLSRGRGPGG